MQLVLSRYTQLIHQYELYLSQNQVKAVKVVERQLAYLVRVTNSFYSYGLPSGSSKFSIYARKAVSDDENLMSQKERPPKP